uniref:Uncharacterized protein n=1 Tax=Tanacetum cinerariifolium TaxID=118510 RepID=A0A699H151_TANCI|nr:hypothetical protein [Tanacetum cinerariifolium]
MFDKDFKRVNTFEDFRTELVQGQEKEKRAREELIQKRAKKQKVEDDKETTKLKKLIEIIPNKEVAAIYAIPLAVKSPNIIDWKIYKEGKKSYYQIIRADGKTKMYMVFSKMLESFDREYLEDLYKLVTAKFRSTRPVLKKIHPSGINKETYHNKLKRDICERVLMLQESRPIIETLKNTDQLKKLLNNILLDKLKLDKEKEEVEEEAAKEVIRNNKTLRGRNDLGVFVIPIRIEGKYDTHSLVDTGSNINVLPYGIYMKLEAREVKAITDKIRTLDHSRAEPMGILRDVLCQVGVTTIVARFLILDIPVDKDQFPIATIKAKTEEENSDNEKEMFENKDNDRKPIYRPDNQENDSFTRRNFDDEAESSQSKRTRKHETIEEALLPLVYHPFLLWKGCNRATKSKYNTKLNAFLHKQVYPPSIVDWRLLNEMGYEEEIKEMLEIKVIDLGGDEEMFTSEAWRRVFDINEPTFIELCLKDHSLTLVQFAKHLGLYENVEVSSEDGYANVAWVISKWMKKKGDGSQRDNMICCGRFITRIAWRMNLLTEDVLRGLSTLTYYKSLDRTTLRELIGSDKRLILEVLVSGAPLVAMHAPLCHYLEDLYDRMGHIELRQEAIKYMEYRQSYH